MRSYLKAAMPGLGSWCRAASPAKDARASATAFSIKCSDIRRDSCSLNTLFISAIFAALRRASAFVGLFCLNID